MEIPLRLTFFILAIMSFSQQITKSAFENWENNDTPKSHIFLKLNIDTHSGHRHFEDSEILEKNLLRTYHIRFYVTFTSNLPDFPIYFSLAKLINKLFTSLS